jgi:hypothetical protein
MQDVSASPFSRAVTLIEWSVVIAIIGALMVQAGLGIDAPQQPGGDRLLCRRVWRGPGSAGRASAGAGGLDSSRMHGAELPLRGMHPVRWATRLMDGILLTNRGIAGLLGILFAF